MKPTSPERQKAQRGPAVRISSAPATRQCEPEVPFVFPRLKVAAKVVGDLNRKAVLFVGEGLLRIRVLLRPPACLSRSERPKPQRCAVADDRTQVCGEGHTDKERLWKARNLAREHPQLVVSLKDCRSQRPGE